MTFRWIPVVLTVTAALLAASCSDPGRGDPEAIRPIPTTTPVTTTSSTTTTTTLATTTTSSSSTSTTTTQPVDPEAATKQEIAQVVIDAREAILEAGYEPVDPTYPAIRESFTEYGAKAIVEALSAMKADGRAFRKTDEDLETVIVLTVELPFENEAVAIACVISDAVEFDVSTGRIVNDDLGSRLVSYKLVNDGGTWLINTADTLARYPGVASCATD